MKDRIKQVRKSQKLTQTAFGDIIGVKGNTITNYETGLRNPRTVQYFTTAESEGKHHPTQKPKELMKYFISTYTDENDVVLDNTMGSGTTCLASKELNRFFVGIEKEKQYYEIAVSRVCGS